MIHVLPHLFSIRVINNFARKGSGNDDNSNNVSIYIPKEIVGIINMYYCGVQYMNSKNDNVFDRYSKIKNSIQ